MRILLLGATGMVGRRIAAEADRRGHDVTAVSRSGHAPAPTEATPATEVTGPAVAAGDASDAGDVARLAEGHDAVVCAVAPPRDGTEPGPPFLALHRAVVQGLRDAGVRRLLVVGGAGSLEASPGVDLADTPDFPEAARGEALAHRDVLAFYRTVGDLDWTYLSPPAEIRPGERTGSFRTGGDRVLADDAGHSRISAEDYAVALLDELEHSAHLRARFTVAH